MSKRGRQEDAVSVAHAIEVLCGRVAVKGETDGICLTPLELQVVALKASLPPTAILMVACGYRVKFYGRDSRAVSRRVGIMCIPGQPFEYSSVPYTRVDLYVHRLVAMGYHVAFADQESAAMRASDGLKSGLFTRTVSQLYSRGTLLPTERVVTNGGGGSNLSNAGSSSKGKAEEEDVAAGDGEAHQVDVAGEAPDWLGADAAPPSVDASELFLLFVDARSTGAREANAAGGEATTAPPLSLVLVSFVTQRRLSFHVRGALELEDITQRYDLAEVIVLAARAPPREPGAQGDALQQSTAGFLKTLPEAYATVLHHELPLNFGPTTNGEEDGKDVCVSGHICASGQDVDDAIEAYLRPYKLDQVYRLLCARHGASAEAKAMTSTRNPQMVVSLSTPTDADFKRSLHLPGPTLRALDVFHSCAGLQGSLIGLLDHSITPCGSRCLRRWLAAPLADRMAIQERQEVILYFMGDRDGGQIEDLLRECARLGDIEAVIGKLYAERCNVTEFIRLLRTVRGVSALAAQLHHGGTEPPSGGTMPPLLRVLLSAVQSTAVAHLVGSHAALLSSSAVTPLDFFGAGGRSTPEALKSHMAAKEAAEAALNAELEAARAVLGLPGLEYRTIGGSSFLLDVPAGKCTRVPAEWVVQTRTKTNVRYHTPMIIEQHIALTAATERLTLAAEAAWRQHQRDTVADVEVMRVVSGVVEAVASLDALHSLAAVTRRPGYAIPTLVDIPSPPSPPATAGNAASVSVAPPVTLRIREGRHPVLDRLLPHGYVSCDVQLRIGGAWLLTGPNMGGKSALMRMVGTFVVMAQIGCGVPAAAALLPVFQGLYCRMGASDAILEGASTFLSEMEETCRILRAPALAASLVLMDELGRGTSSFDGAAVAAATLEYLLRRRATTMFVTHYSYLCDPYMASGDSEGTYAEEATVAVKEEDPCVSCYYMGFQESHPSASELSDGTTPSLVFTYKPCRGVTPSSFGVAIARKAGLPCEVTRAAHRLSLEAEQQHRLTQHLNAVNRFLSSP